MIKEQSVGSKIINWKLLVFTELDRANHQVESMSQLLCAKRKRNEWHQWINHILVSDVVLNHIDRFKRTIFIDWMKSCEKLKQICWLFVVTFVGDQEVIRQVIQNSNAGAPRASTATKELDDLMASLSDFKVSWIWNLNESVVNYKWQHKQIWWSQVWTGIWKSVWGTEPEQLKWICCRFGVTLLRWYKLTCTLI